jgi:uncharacterized protein YpbB
MARQKKLGDRGGVKDWLALATTGDTKRFLRWVILSARNQTMSVKDAAIFGQLALAMLKACETSDFERRLENLERQQQIHATLNTPTPADALKQAGWGNSKYESPTETT